MADFQTYDIEQLNEQLTSNPNGYLIFKDVVAQKTYRIKISNLLGGQSTSYTWLSTTTYALGTIVEWGGKWWKSLAGGNINNIPSENSFWTEVSPANESAIKSFQANVAYKSTIVVVLYNNALYSLKVAAGRPYTAASFITTDWDPLEAPTQPANDNGTRVANTFYVDRAVGSAFQDTTTLAIYKMTNFGTP